MNAFDGNPLEIRVSDVEQSRHFAAVIRSPLMDIEGLCRCLLERDLRTKA